MYNVSHTSGEIDLEYDLEVMIDLVATMIAFWDHEAPYVGNPYNPDQFRQFYSDHNPIAFRLIITDDDD